MPTDLAVAAGPSRRARRRHQRGLARRRHRRIMDGCDERERHYVCVTNVHTVMECQRDAELLRIHNASGLTTPDGMPLVWCAKRAGAADVTRVYGPDLMLALSKPLAAAGKSVFLYGTTPRTLELLVARLRGGLSWPAHRRYFRAALSPVDAERGCRGRAAHQRQWGRRRMGRTRCGQAGVLDGAAPRRAGRRPC